MPHRRDYYGRHRNDGRSRSRSRHNHRYRRHLSSETDRYRYRRYSSERNEYRSYSKRDRERNCDKRERNRYLSSSSSSSSSERQRDGNRNRRKRNISSSYSEASRHRSSRSKSSLRNEHKVSSKDKEIENKNDIKSKRKNKKWEEWEKIFVLNQRKKIKENSYKKIRKISDLDWKQIAFELEKETKKRGIAESGRSWTAIKTYFNTKISTNIDIIKSNNNNNDDNNNNNNAIRENFKNIEDFRGTFIGTFQSFGDDKGKKIKTQNKYICLNDIRLITKTNSDKILCDHIWMKVGEQINKLGVLERGHSKIQFNGRITKYRKGSVRRGIPIEYDYQCSNHNKVILYNNEYNYNKNDMIKIERICKKLRSDINIKHLYYFKSHIEVYQCIDNLLSEHTENTFKAYINDKKPCTQNWCRDIKSSLNIKSIISPIDAFKKNICKRFNEMKQNYIDKNEGKEDKNINNSRKDRVDQDDKKEHKYIVSTSRLMRLLLDAKRVDALLMKGDAVITGIGERSRAKILIAKSMPHSLFQICSIEGQYKEIVSAINLLIDKMAETHSIHSPRYQMTILVEERNIEYLIGKKGNIITEIRSNTNANIYISNHLLRNSSEKTVDIYGERDAVHNGIEMIVKRLHNNPSYVATRMLYDHQITEMRTIQPPTLRIGLQQQQQQRIIPPPIPKRPPLNKNEWRNNNDTNNNLCIYNIPSHLNTMIDLTSHFKEFGDIQKIEVDRQNNRAYVQFSNHSEALKALNFTDPILNESSIQIVWKNSISNNSIKEPPKKKQKLTETPSCSETKRVKIPKDISENIKKLRDLQETLKMYETLNDDKELQNKCKSGIENIANQIKELMIQQKKRQKILDKTL